MKYKPTCKCKTPQYVKFLTRLGARERSLVLKNIVEENNRRIEKQWYEANERLHRIEHSIFSIRPW